MQVVFKNFPPFTNCISEIKNTQKNNAKDTDVVMSMYNLRSVRRRILQIFQKVFRSPGDHRLKYFMAH